MAKKFGVIDWGNMSKKMDEANQKESGKKEIKQDERFYYPDVPKDGKFEGKIRFLPSHDFNSLPIEIVLKHNFKGESGYFNEYCLNMFGKKCPICAETWTEYKKREEEGGKEFAKPVTVQIKKQTYITNILVLEDSVHPENVGKVFLYRIPKTTKEMIDILRIPDKDDPAKKIVYVQDYYGGATFKIETYKQGEFVQYDKCRFLTPNALYDGDEEKIQDVHKRIYTLDEFVSPSLEKSESDLMTKFRKVKGMVVQSSSEEEVESTKHSIDNYVKEETKKKTDEVVVTEKDIEDSIVESEDEIDDFVNLIDNDDDDLPF